MVNLEKKGMGRGILTRKELEVINKKLRNEKLTGQDSNYLSRYVRPKLVEISRLDANRLLKLLYYNQKRKSVENKIKKVILDEVGIKNIYSVVLYGSAVQTNFSEYNDVDVLIVAKKKLWSKLGDKYGLVGRIKKNLEDEGIDVDVEIYDKNTFDSTYSENPSLVYQLKDKKIIYGKLKLKNKISIPKINLRTKVDYSILEEGATGLEIYRAIRNLVLINLIIDKKINNAELVFLIRDDLGKNLVCKLKQNTESKVERKMADLYLKNLLENTLSRLKEAKWEKIVLSNR